MLIVLAGPSGAGKDTTYRLMTKLLTQDLVNVKFVEPFKRMLAMYLGVPLEKLEDRVWREQVIPELNMSPLDIMKRGFELMPELCPGMGLYYTRRQVSDYLNKGQVPVFTDMRNPMEAEYIRELGATKRVFLFQLQRKGTKALDTDRYLSDNIRRLSHHATYHGVIMNYGSYSGLLRAIDDQLINSGIKSVTPQENYEQLFQTIR